MIKQLKGVRWRRVFLFVFIAVISFIGGIISTYAIIEYKLRSIGIGMSFDLFK